MLRGHHEADGKKVTDAGTEAYNSQANAEKAMELLEGMQVVGVC